MVCLWGLSQPAALYNREKTKVNLDFFSPFLKKRSTFCIQLFVFEDGKGFFQMQNFMGRLFVPFFTKKATFNETVFVFSLGGKKNLHFLL